MDDAELIRDECYLVKNVSPELRRTIPEVSQYNLANRGVVGMWPSYQDFRSLKLSEGRLITDDDEREGRRVLVLGSKAYRQLFPGQPAIGASVLVQERSVSRGRGFGREEAEFELQRTGQRLSVRPIFRRVARFPSAG